MASARLLVFVCLLPALCAAQAPIRVDVNLVNVTFSVRDARGNLVSDLTADDFEVLEDGAPQKISFFAPSADVPLNLGLVVDFSGSQEKFFKPHHKDLETFLKNVLAPGDRAFLLCFGNRLRVAHDYGSSPKRLVESLELYEKGPRAGFPELGPPDLREAGTAFYDAIYYSINDMLSPEQKGRRALIVFSDGEDNSSAHHLMDAVEAAQNAAVTFFGVRYTEPRDGRLTARNKYGASVMERIARETGGADFDARAKDLADNFRLIGAQLRASYELGYHSGGAARDGAFHRIAIRAKRDGLQVRSKSGYYAR